MSSNVKVIREVVQKPPINKLEFKSVFGQDCAIKKCYDGDYSLSIGGKTVVVNKEDMEEIINHLNDMKDGK